MRRGGGGGERANKGRKTWGRERGEGDEQITELKTNVISAAIVSYCFPELVYTPATD